MDMPSFEPERTSPVWYKALGFSLLLHAGIVVLLLALHSRPSALPVRPEPQPASLALVLASKNPQLKKPEEVPETNLQALAEQPAPLPEAEESNAGRDVPDKDAEATLTEDLEPVPSAEQQSSAEQQPTQNPIADLLADAVEADSGASGATWSAGKVRAMIGTYASEDRARQTENWLSACLIYNKEHGTAQCPQLETADYAGREEVQAAASGAFANITRGYQQRRVLNALVAETTALQPLLKGNGVLAGLARERLWLNGEYTEYLTGNFDYKIHNFVQASLSSHSANGNGNAAFIRDMFQVVCTPVPCIWEYTGFSVKQPEPEPEGSEIEFRKSPSLFGNTR